MEYIHIAVFCILVGYGINFIVEKRREEKRQAEEQIQRLIELLEKDISETEDWNGKQKWD